MFWHGRSYAHKTLFFILINFLKVWGRIWTNFIFNGVNGMSGVINTYGIYTALFAIVFCNFLVVWWVVDNKDVDQSKDEKNFRYKQSDLYTYCRKDIMQYHKFYFFVILVTILPDLLITFSFAEEEASGSMNKSG